MLELLIVLVLMGVASALVAPAIGLGRDARSAGGDGATAEVVSNARRQAVRRAEPLTLQLTAAGAWTLRSVRDDAVIDSGTVSFAGASTTVPASAWTFDALGGCVPGARETGEAPFDALACRSTAASASPLSASTP